MTPRSSRSILIPFQGSLPTFHMISLLFSASPTTPAPLRRSEPPAESASVNQEAGAVKHTSSNNNDNNNNRLQLWVPPAPEQISPCVWGKQKTKKTCHPSSREQMSQCCCFLLSSVVLIKLHLTTVVVATRCTQAKRKGICMAGY